jgi:hypothetical protein
VSREELEKIPVWNPADGKPAPLTRNRALEIARQAAAAQGIILSDEIRFSVTLLHMHSSYVELLKGQPVSGCLWYYVVDFFAKTDLPGEATFVVSMSGAVATRKIETEK